MIFGQKSTRSVNAFHEFIDGNAREESGGQPDQSVTHVSKTDCLPIDCQVERIFPDVEQQIQPFTSWAQTSGHSVSFKINFG